MIYIKLGIVLLVSAAAVDATWVTNITTERHWDNKEYRYSSHDTVSPKYAYYPTWLATLHLGEMTKEILQDTEIKMNQVEKIVQKYLGTQDFELGYIAGSVQSRFKHMLELYKVFSSTLNFLSQNNSLSDFVDANHIVQSDYHEILGMKDVYDVNVKQFEDIARKKRVLERYYVQKDKMIAATNLSISSVGFGALSPALAPSAPLAPPAPPGPGKRRAGGSGKLRMAEEEKYKENLRKKWHNKRNNDPASYDTV